MIKRSYKTGTQRTYDVEVEKEIQRGVMPPGTVLYRGPLGYLIWVMGVSPMGSRCTPKEWGEELMEMTERARKATRFDGGRILNPEVEWGQFYYERGGKMQKPVAASRAEVRRAIAKVGVSLRIRMRKENRGT